RAQRRLPLRPRPRRAEPHRRAGARPPLKGRPPDGGRPAREAQGTTVIRLVAGGDTGECAAKYAWNASMSSGPLHRSVPWVKTVKPSPPPMRKLLAASLICWSSVTGVPLIAMFDTLEPTGAEALTV